MKIDNKTSIPMFAAIGVLPFIIGGMVWLTNIDSKASQALNDNLKIDHRIEKITVLTQETREIVIRIEEKLKNKGNK